MSTKSDLKYTENCPIIALTRQHLAALEIITVRSHWLTPFTYIFVGTVEKIQSYIHMNGRYPKSWHNINDFVGAPGEILNRKQPSFHSFLYISRHSCPNCRGLVQSIEFCHIVRTAHSLPLKRLKIWLHSIMACCSALCFWQCMCFGYQQIPKTRRTCVSSSCHWQEEVAWCFYETWLRKYNTTRVKVALYTCRKVKHMFIYEIDII